MTNKELLDEISGEMKGYNEKEENLKDITKSGCSKMLETLEIPQELKAFRKKWEEKIDLDPDTKQKIINTVNKIPQRARLESDGSIIIEYELGGEKYKILNVNLKKHSDEEYRCNPDYDSIIHIDATVSMKGFRGFEIQDWYNKKLSSYALQKQSNGFHVPTTDETHDVLGRLGKEANINRVSDEIAMLMYLTGMDGPYRMRFINEDDDQADQELYEKTSPNTAMFVMPSIGCRNDLLLLMCGINNRTISIDGSKSANIWMISHN